MYNFEYDYAGISRLQPTFPDNPKVREVESKEEAQALAQFLYNEGCRHGEDIRQILEDLRRLEKRWGVIPRRIREFVKT